jgi:hypothetical protein
MDTAHDPLEKCQKSIAWSSFDRILPAGHGKHFLETHFDIPTVT